jgi:hypothetical protein
MNLLDKLSNEGLLISTISKNIVNTYVTINNIKPKFCLILFKNKEGAIVKRITKMLMKSGTYVEAILIDEIDVKTNISLIEEYISKNYKKCNFYLFQDEKPNIVVELYNGLKNNNINFLLWDNNKIKYYDNNETCYTDCENDVTFENYLNCIGIKVFNHFSAELPSDNPTIELQSYIANNLKYLSNLFNYFLPQIKRIKKNTAENTITIKNTMLNDQVNEFIKIAKSLEILDIIANKDDVGIQIKLLSAKKLKELLNNWYRDYILGHLKDVLKMSRLNLKNVTFDWHEIKLLPINLHELLIDLVIYNNNKISLVKINNQLTNWKSGLLLENILQFSLLNKFLDANTVLCYPFEVPKKIYSMADTAKIHILDTSDLNNVSQFFSEKLLLHKKES